MSTPKILVRDYMKPVTLYFGPSTDVEAIVKALVEHHALGAPVIDDQKKLVGFVTEQDCIKAILNDGYYSQQGAVASDIMRKSPLSVAPDLSIVELAQSMIAGRRPKLYPVVENGQVIGIISRANVLKALSVAVGRQKN